MIKKAIEESMKDQKTTQAKDPLQGINLDDMFT